MKQLNRLNSSSWAPSIGSGAAIAACARSAAPSSPPAAIRRPAVAAPKATDAPKAAAPAPVRVRGSWDILLVASGRRDRSPQRAPEPLPEEVPRTSKSVTAAMPGGHLLRGDMKAVLADPHDGRRSARIGFQCTRGASCSASYRWRPYNGTAGRPLQEKAGQSHSPSRSIDIALRTASLFRAG